MLFERFHKLRKIVFYKAGIYPSVWQLPNPLKLYEFEQIIRGMNIDKETRIVDLGCGRGIQTQLLARKAEYVIGVDPGKKYITNAERELKFSRFRNKITFMCNTLEGARLPSQSITKIASFCVLEHIENLVDVLHECKRILKPAGELHLTVDSLSNINSQELRDKHRQMYHVVQYFTPDGLREILGNAGFEVTEMRHLFSGNTALAEFTRGIETGLSDYTGRNLRRDYVALALEESQNPNPNSGLMLLCRALLA